MPDLLLRRRIPRMLKRLLPRVRGRATPWGTARRNARKRRSRHNRLRCPPRKRPCLRRRKVRPDTFLDHTQVFLSGFSRIRRVWFDSFSRTSDTSRRGSLGHVRALAERPAMERGQRTSFSLRSSTPVCASEDERKLRLVITSDTEEDKFAPDTGAVLDPAFATAADQKKSMPVFSTIYMRPSNQKSISASGYASGALSSLLSGCGSGICNPLGALWLARFTETAYEKTHDGFSEITQLDFDRTLNQSTLLRISNAVTYTETKNGIEWVPAVSVLHQLSPKDAISYDVSALLVNRPERVMQVPGGHALSPELLPPLAFSRA